MRKSWCSALAALAAIVSTLVSAAPAAAGLVTPMCAVQDPRGPVAPTAVCEATVDAQLTQAGANGSVRVYGWVYAPGRTGLTLSIAVDIGGEYVLIDEQVCASGSNTCTYDHTYPCARDCIGSGWYWLTVTAYSRGYYVGTDQDRTYIVCTV